MAAQEGGQILTLGESGPSSLPGTQPMPRDPEEPLSTHRIMPDNKYFCYFKTAIYRCFFVTVANDNTYPKLVT